MKISYKGDYALKIILDLSLKYEQSPSMITQMKDIAKRQDIPVKFLEQIISMLKAGKFVKTIRGAKGGVQLAKAPAKITLGEVIRQVEGPTSPITCVSRSGYVHCNFENRCAFKGIWEDVRDKINLIVDKVTFKDMIERSKKLKYREVVDYSI